MNLKEVRLSKNLTQQQASDFLGVSLRSYKTYETDLTKADTIKYQYFLEHLQEYDPINEDQGILTLAVIQRACEHVFSQYPVKYAILFGSYARGSAREDSDVDLLISTDVTGLRFFGLAERLRKALHKKVDLLDMRQLENNRELLDEILNDGVKIYVQSEK